jgi:hypothetical protein
MITPEIHTVCNVLDIYIASSARNLHAVQTLRDALQERGHTVLDWTKFAPPLPDSMSPEERRAALDTDERGEIFGFCAQACAGADLVLYLGPSGQDAACEVGMAYVAGVPVFGLAGPLEAPGLILSNAVRKWVADTAKLLVAVEIFAKENACLDMDTSSWVCRVCGCTDDHACAGGCWWVEENLCSTCGGHRGGA